MVASWLVRSTPERAVQVRALAGDIVLSSWVRHFKAGTHEGACSRNTLLQHAPGAKLPRLHQRFLAKNMLRNKTLLPHIKLV